MSPDDDDLPHRIDGALPLAQQKLTGLLALLEVCWPLVHFDPRHPGVDVPPHLRGVPAQALRYGINMPNPIPDLRLEADGIRATLSFATVPTATFIPWDAVFAMVDDEGRGYLWRDSVPRDVAAVDEAAPPPARVLHAVADAPPSTSWRREPPRRGHLKLVN